LIVAPQRSGEAEIDSSFYYYFLRLEGNGMTSEVDANYFRKNWVEHSHNFKSDEAALPSRATCSANDDARYQKLCARIARLHESFDAWCEEGVDVPADRRAVCRDAATAQQ
jgi:hypothetical protein